jgi:hypothetical protein
MGHNHRGRAVALVAIGLGSYSCSERPSRQKADEPLVAAGVSPSREPRCPFDVHERFEVRFGGVPHPFETIEVKGAVAYARLPTLGKLNRKGLPLRLETSGTHDFEASPDGDEVWRRLDGGAPTLVALALGNSSLRREEHYLFAWARSPAVPATRLLRLTEDQARELAALRVHADAFEVPDLSRFGGLTAVELEFNRPLMLCSADELRDSLLPDSDRSDPFGSRPWTCSISLNAPHELTQEARLALQQQLTQHTQRWIAHTKKWLQALPETVEYLRLVDAPVEALEALPHGIAHLELEGVYGPGGELSLSSVPGIGSVRTLVVESSGRPLSLEGLEELRALSLRRTPIDWKHLASLRQLEQVSSDSVLLGPLLEHPALKTVDARQARIHDWAKVSGTVDRTALRRLTLVDARDGNVGNLEQTGSSSTVLYTSLDELRATLGCATRIVAREYHELCAVWHSMPVPRVLTTASPIPSLAIMRSLLNDARDGYGHQRSCDMPVLDVYQGSAFVLTLHVSDDCRSLSSDVWRSGVSLTDDAARRLCTWLGRQEAPDR